MCTVMEVRANQANLELCLVGRFLTNRAIRVHAVKERMAEVWRAVKGVSIKELQRGLYLFQFYHKLDLQRVFNGGPWSFNNHMLILGMVQSDNNILTQIPLYHVCFWVQVHDLPVGFMLPVVGEHLGNFIGEFVEYDTNNNVGIWKPFMRIKVGVDVRNPLKKERKVRKAGGEWNVVKFKYERLGIFCYLCGVVMGHTDQYCEKLYTMESDDGARNWGPEIRADLWRRGGSTGGSREESGGGGYAKQAGGYTSSEQRAVTGAHVGSG